MESWANLAPDLHLDPDPALGKRVGLERALRDAVRAGQFRPGIRLPSSRALATDLGIARNTVAEVYSQLVAEGYLISRRGAGTRVADYPDLPRHDSVVSLAADPDLGDEPSPRFDLRPGRPDLTLFPQAEWLAGARTVLQRGGQQALGYGDPRGPRHAREILAAYLARVRGVSADPAQVVLCTGYRQAVALFAAALHQQGRTTVAVELPGLPEVASTLSRVGAVPIPLPVDEGGACVQLLDRQSVDAVVLTPAHQFPTGVPLSSRRRGALLGWAHRTNGIILEDDYDGEFRYDRQPIGAVQGLSPDHVLYAGSASKTLAPGLRLGWLVVPQDLLDGVIEAKRWPTATRQRWITSSSPR